MNTYRFHPVLRGVGLLGAFVLLVTGCSASGSAPAASLGEGGAPPVSSSESAPSAPAAPDATGAGSAVAAGGADEAPVPLEITGDGETLTIGIEGDKPGVAMKGPSTATGFSVDVAAYIAMKLGYSPYSIVWLDAPSDKKEQYLKDGTVDLVVSSYSITDERRADVDFAGPYLISGQDLLVRADDDSITGPETLAGKTVCVVPATTSIRRIKEIAGDKAKYVERESSTECLPLLLSGEVDAVTSDDILLAEMAATPENAGKLRVVGNRFSTERIGVGLPNGSTELCEKINVALQDMIDDGSWSKFVERHTIGTGYNPSDYDNPPTFDPCE